MSNYALVCNIDRTHDLSRRINKRMYPTNPIPVGFSPRPVQTKQVQFPILDCRKKPTVPLEDRGVFCEKRIFTPGDSAPFNGYMSKVDDESKLYNIIFPDQPGFQSKFIPGMESDLYINEYLVKGREEVNPYPGLFHTEKFNESNNQSDQIGFKTFNNHTRQQTKNLK
tara:strand:- start:2003 stop:2506 length:504 start_codon:yes stop_codon:yes gene_type:complete